MTVVDAANELIEQAWEQAYLDVRVARGLGEKVVALMQAQPFSEQAGFGWLHVALADMRAGELPAAELACAQARHVFEPLAMKRGLALVDELVAIAHRRRGNYAASAAMHDDIDRRTDRGYNDHDHFIANNSRAITCKHLGRTDDALRHFYRSLAHARRTPWRGPEILALGNLGGFHQDLFNLEDARTLSERALSLARNAGARQVLATAAGNLIAIYHALGQNTQAMAMAEYLLNRGDELLPGALQQLATSVALGLYCGGDVQGAQHYLQGRASGNISDGDGKPFWSWLQARCWLQLGDAQAAWQVSHDALTAHAQCHSIAQPYDLMQLYRVAADTSELRGDLATALTHTRMAHTSYEDLVGRSARARFITLEVTHKVDDARHERDQALLSRQTAEDDRQRLTRLNTQLQEQIQANETLQTQLREQVLRDPLTGLHNRRYLFEVAPRLLDLAQRQKNDLCVVLLDLDHFKAVNDQWGHESGDVVLRVFSGLLLQSLRRTDVVCRHGGEEFVIVMPDIALEGAENTLQRLLAAFAQLRINTAKHTLPPVAFSAGIAVFPNHGVTLDQLLSRADRALYAAKDAGRARIEVAQNTDFSTLS